MPEKNKCGSREIVLGTGRLVPEEELLKLSSSDPDNVRRLAVLVNY